jgi:sulfite reductase (NADPH) hemoprotein beta-component
VVFVSLKLPGQAPGDMTDSQMDALAELTDRYSQGELRVTHTQNLVLADVKLTDLQALWQQLSGLGLATANIGTAADIICCPGLDFCSLANATSIPIANGIQQLFEDTDYLYDLGDIRINISGCMNGCGHHTVGHIGILGVDKKGEEWYQITLGGSSATEAALGERLGPAVSRDQVVSVIDSIFTVYRNIRTDEEPFLATVQRVGLTPFQERVYGTH